MFKAGTQADGHGFGFVDPAEEQASDGAAGYYSWSPTPGFRFISLDTVSEAGVIGPSADGNIDDPQFQWLEDELEGGDRRGRARRPVQPPRDPQPDRRRPRRVGAAVHRADATATTPNPGCDIDPRGSSRSTSATTWRSCCSSSRT